MADDSPPFDVALEHPTFEVDTDVLAQAVRRIIEGERARVEYLAVVLTDHDAVLDLNRTYLQHDYRTDVLSFDLSESEDPAVIDGEVYVDLDTALERHAEFGASFEEEVA
ncbi:MAG TPA: rRNA maturation RNase YbeY, partial [Rhodothermales bacterium]|nr:rRNA maturation RNase YbeY [Rhodothermales bacterium]